MTGKWEAAKKEQAYAQLLKTTRAVGDYAARKNMMVELEVFDYVMDKAVLIGPAHMPPDSQLIANHAIHSARSEHDRIDAFF